ncbi:response regulator transcription factor [Bacillus sp. AGMB 02131]|uniref:Response regulator transcription factor n=1 Tax=Peribacillus faecalis TaxID=2772559 RepID=A0A927CVZ2_9BACI|nr:response regulator transcription factor [Peribacillus faecalis]MBD3108798.1 response regulator transcription factor [Peribacillus faecalis]
MQQAKILIIEDAETLRNELAAFLRNYGYEVEAPDDFQNVMKYASQEDIHLILLDINLPVFDGYYICREIRKTSQVPIIIVTSRDTEIDELMSMNLGADDFVTKPYNTQILLARIENILRRTYAKQESAVLSFKDLQLHLANGTISYRGKQEELTKNELKILHCLMKNKDKIVSREQLMEDLWSSDLFVDDNTLSVNITRLRKKLEAIGMDNPIETRRGMGYIIS